MQSTDETSTKLNDLPKIVVSSTLQEPFTWSNTRALRGDLSQSIKSLKAQAGPPLRSMGSVSLVKSLLSLGLIDCLRLVVFPLTLRDKGREHIFDGFPVGTYNLAGESVLDSRLVVLEYHPDLPKDTNAKR